MVDKNKLPAVLGLSALPVEEEKPAIEVDEDVNDVRADYERSRMNLIETLESVKKTIDDLESLADQSQNPRFYEVLAQLYKTKADLSRDLMNLHRQHKEVQRARRDLEDTGHATPQQIQNNLFVGTTNDLLDIIKKANSGNA